MERCYEGVLNHIGRINPRPEPAVQVIYRTARPTDATFSARFVREVASTRAAEDSVELKEVSHAEVDRCWKPNWRTPFDWSNQRGFRLSPSHRGACYRCPTRIDFQETVA